MPFGAATLLTRNLFKYTINNGMENLHEKPKPEQCAIYGRAGRVAKREWWVSRIFGAIMSMP